jgi:hypothetical protein
METILKHHVVTVDRRSGNAFRWRESACGRYGLDIFPSDRLDEFFCKTCAKKVLASIEQHARVCLCASDNVHRLNWIAGTCRVERGR